MIKIHHIQGGYASNILFEDADITLYPNVINGIIGKSGIGKSTLLYIIGLLNFDISFDYQWMDKDIRSLSDFQQADIRRKDIGYLMQDKIIISDQLRLKDNINCMYALVSRKYDSKEVNAFLEMLKLDHINLNRYPNSLSGGELQRFALLLAIIKKPKLLICDEPTSALDHDNAEIFMDVLRKLSHQGVIVIIASHDPDIIQNMGVVYEIKNRKLNLWKRTLQSGITTDRLHIKKRIDKKFFKFYTKRLREKYLYVFYGIMMAILCLLSILPSLFSMQRNDYLIALNNVSNKEILVVNTSSKIPNPQYLDNVPAFSVDDIKMIKKFPYIDHVIPFYQLHVADNEQSITINGELKTKVKDRNLLVLQPYISDEEHILISKEAATMLNLKKQDELLLEVTTDVDDSTQIPIMIKDFQIQEANQYNPYSSLQKVIYVPYQILENLIPANQFNDMSKSLLVDAASIEHVEFIISEITRWLPSCSILYNLGKIEKQLETIDILDGYMDMFYVASLGISILFLLFHESFSLKKRANSFSNLMMNGLMKKDLYKIIVYEKRKEVMILAIGIPIVFMIGFSIQLSIANIGMLLLKYLFFLSIFEVLSTSITIYSMKRLVDNRNISKGFRT